jgi:hypothetical protein
MTISRSERLRTTQEVYKQWVESGIDGGILDVSKATYPTIVKVPLYKSLLSRFKGICYSD